MHRLPAQTRLSLAFVTLSFACSFLPCYLLFLHTVEQTLDDTARKLSSIAAVAALNIDGDLHASVQGQGPQYNRVVEQMRQILWSNTDQSIVHVYSLRLEKPRPGEPLDETEFAVDSARPTDFPWLAPEDIAQYSSKYCLDEGMKRAFSGLPGSTANLYRNGCGVWRTGYAPIRTKAGEIDAVLCVDGSVFDEDLRVHALRQTGQSIVLIAMLAGFLLSLLVGRWTLKSPRSATGG